MNHLHQQCVAAVLALGLLGTPPVLADEPPTPRHARKTLALTTSLVTPFFGAYYLDAELRALNHLGVLVNTSYLSLEHDDWKTRTGTVGAGARYYFQGDALRRWYAEANGELMFSSWRHEPSDKVAPVVLGYTGTALVGYRFLCDRGPLLDVGAGVVALRFPSARVQVAGTEITSEAFTKVYPAVKVNVGWAF